MYSDKISALAIIQANYENENKKTEILVPTSVNSGTPEQVNVTFEADPNIDLPKYEGLKKISNVLKILQLPPKNQELL